MKNVKRSAAKTAAKTTRKNAEYQAVSQNIYFDGSSYRVRISRNGKQFSKNFSSKKQAITYRNSITTM